MRALPARLLVVTDRRLARAPLEDVVADALAGGARWIWLRDRDLPRDARHALGRRLLALCAAAGATLSVGGDATDVLAIGAQAAHAPAGADLRALRAALGPRALIGVSAHGADELRRARDAGADYATLSPVFATASKPGYGPALGLAALADAPLPVVALGGVEAETAGACLRAGAAAVAAMGGVMRAPAPRRAVERLLAAMAEGDALNPARVGCRAAGRGSA